MSWIARLKADDRPIAIAAGFVLVILALGTLYTAWAQGTAPLLSPIVQPPSGCTVMRLPPRTFSETGLRM